MSSFDVYGHKDENRTASLLRRFGKFVTESLWNSLYSRLYREMLLDPLKAQLYGRLAASVMKYDNRRDAVESARKQAFRVLLADPMDRSEQENSFVYGVLSQRNQLRDRICKGWTNEQFSKLTKKISILRCEFGQTIIDSQIQAPNSCYVILRGCVRVFSQPQGYNQPYYEEDLVPGEVFCETALSGRIGEGGRAARR